MDLRFIVVGARERADLIKTARGRVAGTRGIRRRRACCQQPPPPSAGCMCIPAQPSVDTVNVEHNFRDNMLQWSNSSLYLGELFWYRPRPPGVGASRGFARVSIARLGFITGPLSGCRPVPSQCLGNSYFPGECTTSLPYRFASIVGIGVQSNLSVLTCNRIVPVAPALLKLHPRGTTTCQERMRMVSTEGYGKILCDICLDIAIWNLNVKNGRHIDVCRVAVVLVIIRNAELQGP